MVTCSNSAGSTRQLASVMPLVADQIERRDQDLFPTAQRNPVIMDAVVLLVRRRVRALGITSRRLSRDVSGALSPVDLWLLREAGFVPFARPEFAGAPWRDDFLPDRSQRCTTQPRTLQLISKELDISVEAARWWLDCAQEQVDFEEALLWAADDTLADERTTRILSELADTSASWFDEVVRLAGDAPQQLTDTEWLRARPHLASTLATIRRSVRERYPSDMAMVTAQQWEKNVVGWDIARLRTSGVDWCKYCDLPTQSCPHRPTTSRQPARRDSTTPPAQRRPEATARTGAATGGRADCASCHRHPRIKGHLYCPNCARQRGYARCRRCNQRWLVPSEVSSPARMGLCADCYRRAKDQRTRGSVFAFSAGLPGLGR